MQLSLQDQAIKSALDGDWQAAIEINQQILNDTPNHIPALNRLAKAYAQTGQSDKAIELYQQVLQIDKFNQIARKQCQLLKKSPCIPQKNVKITMTNFIEEPGKTRTCDLNQIGDSKNISSLQPGQPVKLVVKSHWIVVTTEDDSHVGRIPENVSFKLKKQIDNGQIFDAVIKSASTAQVSVFIRQREVK